MSNTHDTRIRLIGYAYLLGNTLNFRDDILKSAEGNHVIDTQLQMFMRQ